MKIKDNLLKIGWFLGLTLFLIGTVVVANNVFFKEVKIEISGITWVDDHIITDFEIKIPKIVPNENSSYLVIENGYIIDNRLVVEKANINIGFFTNNKILVPLRIISNIEDSNNFFVPEFRAEIKAEENLKAIFSLYLLTESCPLGNIMSNIKVASKNLYLCDVGISHTGSGGAKSFSITSGRKTALIKAIKNLPNKNNYILVLKIEPNLETIKNNNISSFAISIENITPEVISY